MKTNECFSRITIELERRRQLFIDKQLKDFPEKDVELIKEESERKFNYEDWIVDASKRAKFYSVATHNCKYVHSSAKTSPIYYTPSKDKSEHGLLISGLFKTEHDAFGSAGSIDVFGILSLKTDSGRTILEHLLEETEDIKEAFQFDSMPFSEVRAGFLKVMFKDEETLTTDVLVKQVFFPVNNTYYNFSILPASGIMYEIKKRVEEIRYSSTEDRKEAKEQKKANKYSEYEHHVLPDVTEIRYGGSQAHNVGFLNKKSFGLGYLLRSLPPKKRAQHEILPKKDLITTDTLYKKCSRDISLLRKQTENYYSNKNINDAIKDTIKRIFDQVIELVYEIRSVGEGWSSGPSFSKVPYEQKIVLDDQYEDLREQASFSEDFIDEIGAWILLKVNRPEDHLLTGWVYTTAKEIGRSVL